MKKLFSRRTLRARFVAMTAIPLLCVALIGLVTAAVTIGVLARRDAQQNLARTVREFERYVQDEESSMLGLALVTSANRDIVFQTRSLTELTESDPADLSMGVMMKIAKDLQGIFAGRDYSRIVFYHHGVLRAFLTPTSMVIADGKGGFETPASPSALILYSAETWRKVTFDVDLPLTLHPSDAPRSRLTARGDGVTLEVSAPIVITRYDPGTFAGHEMVAAEIVIFKEVSGASFNRYRTGGDRFIRILDLEGRFEGEEQAGLNKGAQDRIRQGPLFKEAPVEGEAHYACFDLLRDGDEAIVIVGAFESMRPVFARARAVVFWQILGAAVVLVAAIILFFVVANRVIRPIVNTSSYIASIDLRQPEQYRVPTPAFNRHDELGVLITSINCFLENLAENLAARRQAESGLKELNADLERRVEARTEELRGVNEALQIAIEKAEQATEAKTAFLANVSHELRTPLNCILGYAQILREDPVICEPQRHYVEIINQSGEHLLDLINEVLEISKIEAKKVQLKLEPVDVYRFLDNLEAMFALRAKERELRFTIARSTELPRFLVTDKNKLRQILINLIGNAMNHTLHGSVHLAVDVEQTGCRTTLLITVTDTGVGIAADDLEKIFEPFFQVEHSQAPSIGTGLGLSICKGYAKLLGSEITVSSVAGQGSTFGMRLVAETGVAEPEEQTESFLGVKGLAAVQETKRILIADDNDSSREMLLLVLGGIGMQVREARNGQEAVDLFHALHPDLILMDMRMPVLDGLEATRQIRQSPGGGDVRIVAFSGNVFEEQRQEMIDAGCNDVLGKPVLLSDLFLCLKRQLGLRYICS